MTNSAKNDLKSPKVSIVTVGMNHLKYMKELLYSVYVEFKPSVDFEFIYVDNCSTDGTVEFIESRYPLVHVVKNDTVKGFGENNNIGVLKATGKYIAIVNPDITLLCSSIDNLFKYSESNKNVGIVVPQLLNPDLSVQYSVRSFISLKILFMRLFTFGNDSSRNPIIKEYLLKDIDVNKSQPVNWAIGASLFIKHSFYKELKGFDEDYFLYLEDADICFRSWKMNRPVIYLPMSKMIHNHLRMSAKLNKTTFYHFQSMFLFFKKNIFFKKRISI